MNGTIVREYMTGRVSVIHQDRDVHELERLLLQEKVHGVPVVDDNDRLVGVVSQTDLLAWHFETGVDGAPFYDRSAPPMSFDGSPAVRLDDIRTAKVEELMSPLAYCIGPDQPIAKAAAMMIEKWIHRLVVVDGDLRVLGVLSAIDLMHSIPGTAEELRQLRAEEPTGSS